VVAGITCGNGFTCALAVDGTVWCWGMNQDGELGDGLNDTRSAAGQVMGIPIAYALAAGSDHACAVTSLGMWCWGNNSVGQLGTGITGEPSMPNPQMVTGLDLKIAAVVAGGQTTCVLAASGAVYCWGFNGEGEVGDGTTMLRAHPTQVTSLGTRAKAIAMGSDVVCAIAQGMPGNEIVCWGDNKRGQLGFGDMAVHPSPVIANGSGAFTSLAAGAHHVCAFGAGAPTCWGANMDGQLGDATNVDRPYQVAVQNLPAGAVAMAAGGGVTFYNATTMKMYVEDGFTCALGTDKSIRCWGVNDFGQLGDGTTMSRPTP
jgi:alpha-tubulin suppressor-like RCC1 family protein